MDKLRRFGEKLPAKRICGVLARDIVKNMKSSAPFWLGNLQSSIQSRITRDGYNIHMASYGIWADTGTRPHWVPNNSALEVWAATKGINWFVLKWHISKKGTEAHPFVQPSIDKTMNNFYSFAGTTVKNTLKESGFRE